MRPVLPRNNGNVSRSLVSLAAVDEPDRLVLNVGTISLCLSSVPRTKRWSVDVRQTGFVAKGLARATEQADSRRGAHDAVGVANCRGVGVDAGGGGEGV